MEHNFIFTQERNMLMTPDFPAQRPPVIWSDPADTPEELTYRLKKNPTLYDRYQRLNRKW